ncbi:MAG TPA: hypothetical protein VG013_27915 [Gemmataceae bacterium]|jgi:uncharacterized integral membrane protein|nr:hypothetical protein [Gemmataceae bacterium]
MRFVSLILLLIILAAIAIFVIQNNDPITLHYKVFNYLEGHDTLTLPVSVLAFLAYVLGMLSGWTVVGFLKHSLVRVAEDKR